MLSFPKYHAAGPGPAKGLALLGPLACALILALASGSPAHARDAGAGEAMALRIDDPAQELAGDGLLNAANELDLAGRGPSFSQRAAEAGPTAPMAAPAASAARAAADASALEDPSGLALLFAGGLFVVLRVRNWAS